MKKSQEVYLVSFALVLLSVIILYDLYSTQDLSPAVVKKTAGISSVSTTHNNTIIAEDTEDIQQVYNPNPTKSQQKSQQKSITSLSNVININTATVQELTTLKGVGEVKANSIVNYRTENGYFSCIDEIKNVKGIGEKTFENIKNDITI